MRNLLGGLIISSTLLMAGNFNAGLKLFDSGKLKEAYTEFLTLAKSGDVDAQTMLGEMYLDGIGVEQNNKKAFYWIYKAAHSSDKEAKYLLGFMYENGIEVDRDLSLAVKWYEDASRDGDIMAMYNLAFIYKEGTGGIKRNIRKAESLLSRVIQIRSKTTM
jgi:TPR repeat protein